jgi:hypothetical protein
MRLLATVHLFKKPDGNIGASGQPDPIVVVVDGVPIGFSGANSASLTPDFRTTREMTLEDFDINIPALYR